MSTTKINSIYNRLQEKDFRIVGTTIFKAKEMSSVELKYANEPITTDVVQKYRRSWEEVPQKLGRSWEEVGKKLGRSWEK